MIALGGRGTLSPNGFAPGLNDSMFGYERLRLPKKEYGKVIHAIDTIYGSRFAGQVWGTIALDIGTGAFLYTFIIFENGTDENTYRDYFIIDKERIL